MENRVADDAVQRLELLDDLGAIIGGSVRASVGDPRVVAAILIGMGDPILTLNDAVVGTDAQAGAIIWAIRQIRVGVAGFSFLRAPG